MVVAGRTLTPQAANVQRVSSRSRFQGFFSGPPPIFRPASGARSYAGAVYDVAALAIVAACFAVVFLLLYVLGRV
jgi:hypothetical protein